MRGSILFRTIALCCLTIALPSLATAQPGDGDDREALQPGSWALQFGISDNFTLRSFEGGVISAKRQMSEHSALRFGVAGRFRTQEDELSTSRADTLLGTSTVSDDQFLLGFDLHFLRYADPDSRVKFYYGAGPTVGWDRRTSENKLMGSSGNERTVEQEFSSWWFGVSAIAGVEWFFTRELSLHAEYGLEGVYASQRQENSETTSDRSNDRDTTGFRVWDRSVLFGLSAYF